ncbi:hypothetical protein [Streptomyces fulvoviolaceus]|uniref:hypothetical protein n=1 Tax=Streptomyces fulvoviolaceus TaxID=285535 RepID=UPI0021BE6EC4|nr:hypothetical protein [Streptomyces fulvoviolaceus]MCT9078971.1 hypothetical protein [Streptomyces fulvoviolaceus]
MNVSHESLTQLLGRVDSESALISGGLCVYRVLPILYLEGQTAVRHREFLDVERWTPAALSTGIGELLEQLRRDIDPDAFEDLLGEDSGQIAELYSMAAEMVLRYFADDFDVADWSDWSSTLVLDIHQQLDELQDESGAQDTARFFPAGSAPDLTPLQALELADQIAILDRLVAGDLVDHSEIVEIAENGSRRVRSALSLIAREEG